jgi:hypothetical protein
MMCAPEPKRIFEQIVAERWSEQFMTVKFASARGALKKLFEAYLFSGSCHLP